MYLSHPVRRMRDDPIEGELVTLVVTAADDERAGTLESELEAIGESVERLQFGALAVTVPESAVESVCALDGIESIETDEAIGVGGDAGEDV